MTTPQATTKIVIVAGQEFSVPADTPNEAIRQQLTSMGFADVASATIQTGTRTIDGTPTETIEFIKKAGTKGLGAAELAALLTHVPPTGAASTIGGLTRDQTRLLNRLTTGDLTCVEAVFPPVAAALGALLNHLEESRGGSAVNHEGGRLCATLDRLGAVAAPAPSAW